MGIKLTKPIIILVNPQLGQNIGATARAMMNCGLDNLRLVAPRDGWPNPAASAMAAGADRILEDASVYATLDDAIADCQFVAATTARLRDQVKPTFTPRTLAERLVANASITQAILFGGERSGLSNDDIGRANAVINVPLNPEHSSLNLAQAVLLVAYEWWVAHNASRQNAGHLNAGHEVSVADPDAQDALAPKQEIDNFLNRLVDALDESQFLGLPDKRPKMVRNIRNIFERGDYSSQEVRTLHGIVKSLRQNKR